MCINKKIGFVSVCILPFWIIAVEKKAVRRLCFCPYYLQLHIVEVNELLKSLVLSLCSCLGLSEEFLCSFWVVSERTARGY